MDALPSLLGDSRPMREFQNKKVRMGKKSAVMSFTAVQLLSFLGLLLSGIVWAPVSLGVTAMAILGSVAIATLVWVPVFYFITKYNQKRGSAAR